MDRSMVRGARSPFGLIYGPLISRRRPDRRVEAMHLDMAAARTKSTRATRQRRPPRRRRGGGRGSLLRRRPSLALPVLEPHHIDIIGLALIALGIFLSGVAYLHWAGGTLGEGAVHAMRFVFGALGLAVPAALVVGGALVLARELHPPARPMRTGALCLVGAVTLALAAGTLGVGPGTAPKAQYWHPAVFEARGGVMGQAEYWVASHLLSGLGADILALFLFLAALILVSGATLAGVLRTTGAGVAGTGRALRRSTEELSATVARRTAAVPPPSTAAARAEGFDPAELEAEEAPVLPPEADTAELVVRATHVEAPPIGNDRDEPAEDQEPEGDAAAPESEPGEREFGPEDLTPQGRLRASVTEDPDFVWRVPGARFLTRSSGEAARP